MTGGKGPDSQTRRHGSRPRFTILQTYIVPNTTEWKLPLSPIHFSYLNVHQLEPLPTHRLLSHPGTSNTLSKFEDGAI